MEKKPNSTPVQTHMLCGCETEEQNEAKTKTATEL